MRKIMATRSSSNKKVTKRNTNVPPPARNYSDNTQAVKRIPGVTYGEQDALVEQQKIAPLPKTGTPQARSGVRARSVPNIDVFSGTQFANEPVTAGLPFGPGTNGPVDSRTAGVDMVKNFIYESWLATGDDSLLEYL